MLGGFGELDLEAKGRVAFIAISIGVSLLIGYATVKQIKMQDKITKRMHLDEGEDNQ